MTTPTPLCDKLGRHPLDSNDIRAWKSLASRLETVLRLSAQYMRHHDGCGKTRISHGPDNLRYSEPCDCGLQQRRDMLARLAKEG